MNTLVTEYMKDKGLKPVAFAKLAKISPAFFSKYKNGKSITLYYAKKIEEATGGEITAKELLFPSPIPPRPGQADG